MAVLLSLDQVCLSTSAAALLPFLTCQPATTVVSPLSSVAKLNIRSFKQRFNLIPWNQTWSLDNPLWPCSYVFMSQHHCEFYCHLVFLFPVSRILFTDSERCCISCTFKSVCTLSHWWSRGLNAWSCCAISVAVSPISNEYLMLVLLNASWPSFSYLYM